MMIRSFTFIIIFLLSYFHYLDSSAQCNLFLGNDTTYCGTPFILDAGANNYTYEWSTGATSQTITVSGIGVYAVTVTQIGANQVVNGDFELGNTGFTTNYTYNSSSLWNEGTYWVGYNAAVVHPNFVGIDHTAPPGVNFMIINGSSIPGTIVWQQTINITAGINYIFSAWICSLVSSNPAQLQFYINNVPVGNVFTAPNAVNTWVQFYELWNSGGNTTATISLVNQNALPSGNDFGIDDIYFAPINPCIDTIFVNPPNLAISPNTTNIACKGESTGQIDLTINGGYAPYTYSWSSGQNTQDLNNVSAGSYSVTVSDDAGCTVDQQFTLTEPAFPLEVNTSVTAVDCAGNMNGSILVTANGGSFPYTFHWNTGSGNQDLINVSGGIYTLSVTDLAGCLKVFNLEVPEPDPLEILLDGDNLSCHGDTDGFINAIVTGGSPDYIYQWSNGGNLSAITSLSAGAYTLTVYDVNSCSNTQTMVLTEPSLVSLYNSGDQTICLGQSANIVSSAFGGTPPYTYFWNPGGFGISSITVNPETTTEYCVYIEDDHHCKSNTNCITIFVKPPLELNLNISSDTICQGDTIFVQSDVEGGNGGPYFIELAGGGIIGNNWPLSPDHSGKIIVTAMDGCGTPSVSDTAFIEVFPVPMVSFKSNIISGCQPLEVQFTNLFPEDTEANIWDFGDSPEHNFSSEINPVHTFLNPGIYDISLYVQNKYACENQTRVENLIEVFPKPIAAFSADQQMINQVDGSMYFINESSGASDFFWQFGDGDSLMVEQPDVHYFPSFGEYQVSLMVESLDGCRDTAYMLVSVDKVETSYVPNAINPLSSVEENRVFRLLGTQVEPDDYYMAIYNRWGEVIFDSTNIEEGWNGRINNELVSQGQYTWLIRYTDTNGKVVRKSGILVVFY